MMVAAIFFYQGVQKTFGGFGGQGWHETISTWTAVGGLSHFTIIVTMLAELLISLALFLGLLTRLASLTVVIITIGSLVYMSEDSAFDVLQFPLLLLTTGLSLLFMGGGYLSIDRAIGKRLLPYVG